ncbi:hypothetical protein PTSG_00517 [Salpingoeca rosetta]|uniref:PH domain-containing protein n=1 Tax=Salpingoeca rosetta (strain ATCC 50818 / BSB-021) TaxID=946362 RepID=F2TWP5_SALR5|nr:uncharacterized protein PTSG_00517 [Salpingoeca rosetta]EGD72491.1 hypothetical protein PTSG_00517 [Salpingoeca rosetta]|eukprot:XP_004999060.1 hypothetical protein PTSG_00517 [Salpingoeca rosetta]
MSEPKKVMTAAVGAEKEEEKGTRKGWRKEGASKKKRDTLQLVNGSSRTSSSRSSSGVRSRQQSERGLDLDLAADTNGASVKRQLSAPDMEGFVLKKCRRNGDDRPWKRRWFMLCSGSIFYHHTQAKADPVRLFVDVAGASVEPCDAPSGFGIAIRRADQPRSHCFAVRTENERRSWLAALANGVARPPLRLPEDDDDDLRRAPGGMYRFKSALASAFATSSLGKHLIRRYLDDAARALISHVLDFTEAEAGRSVRGKMETYIFDLASRVAIIVHENALPANLDTSTLFDETITFCQLYVRFSRDRRLAKQRQLAVELSAPSEQDATQRQAVISDVDASELLRAIAYVTSVWRTILQHNVSEKTLDRFDFVVEHLLQEDRISAIFDKTEHRQRMCGIEQSLRELMEIY